MEFHLVCRVDSGSGSFCIPRKGELGRWTQDALGPSLSAVGWGSESLPKGLRKEHAGVGLLRAYVSWQQNHGRGGREKRPGEPAVVAPQAVPKQLLQGSPQQQPAIG